MCHISGRTKITRSRQVIVIFNQHPFTTRVHFLLWRDSVQEIGPVGVIHRCLH